VVATIHTLLLPFVPCFHYIPTWKKPLGYHSYHFFGWSFTLGERTIAGSRAKELKITCKSLVVWVEKAGCHAHVLKKQVVKLIRILSR